MSEKEIGERECSIENSNVDFYSNVMLDNIV